MTNELEKQFFDTFGIEPIEIPSREYDSDGEICSYYVEYPIPDRILLELICILNSVSVEFKSECIEDLKREILGETIILLEHAPNEETAKFIKHQVRTLFEEER